MEEQIKTALETLQQALIRLDMTLQADKARLVQTEARATELQQALKATHDRLQKAIEAYRQGGE